MDYNDFLQDFNDMVIDFKDDFLNFIPKLILSIIVLAIGYLLAKLIKFLIIRLMRYFNKMINYWFKNSLTTVNLDKSANFVGSLIFWLIFLSVFILISDILGLTLVANWIESFLKYSPNILAAILIVLIAVFAGRIVAEIMSSVTKKIGFTRGKTLGMIVQYLILITAIIIAIDQIGIEISFLITLINIIVAALLFGAGLAFGLGARNVVSNILAVYYISKTYKVGDKIRIGDIQGKINRIDTTAVLLDTPEGQVVIPAKEFNENKSFLIKHEQ